MGEQLIPNPLHMIEERMDVHQLTQQEVDQIFPESYAQMGFNFISNTLGNSRLGYKIDFDRDGIIDLYGLELNPVNYVFRKGEDNQIEIKKGDWELTANIDLGNGGWWNDQSDKVFHFKSIALKGKDIDLSESSFCTSLYHPSEEIVINPGNIVADLKDGPQNFGEILKFLTTHKSVHPDFFFNETEQRGDSLCNTDNGNIELATNHTNTENFFNAKYTWKIPFQLIPEGDPMAQK